MMLFGNKRFKPTSFQESCDQVLTDQASLDQQRTMFEIQDIKNTIGNGQNSREILNSLIKLIDEMKRKYDIYSYLIKEQLTSVIEIITSLNYNDKSLFIKKVYYENRETFKKLRWFCIRSFFELSPDKENFVTNVTTDNGAATSKNEVLRIMLNETIRNYENKIQKKSFIVRYCLAVSKLFILQIEAYFLKSLNQIIFSKETSPRDKIIAALNLVMSYFNQKMLACLNNAALLYDIFNGNNDQALVHCIFRDMMLYRFIPKLESIANNSESLQQSFICEVLGHLREIAQSRSYDNYQQNARACWQDQAQGYFYDSNNFLVVLQQQLNQQLNPGDLKQAMTGGEHKTNRPGFPQGW